MKQLTDTFLTQEELFDLTGCKQAKGQIKVLKENGIPFFTNIKGQPRVTRDWIHGKQYKAPQKQKKDWRPNVLGIT